jgi:hypothetical protein
LVHELVAQIGHENSDRNPEDQDHQEAPHGQKGYKATPESFFFFGFLFVHGYLHSLDKASMFVIDYSHYNRLSEVVKENAGFIWQQFFFLISKDCQFSYSKGAEERDRRMGKRLVTTYPINQSRRKRECGRIVHKPLSF